MLCFGALGSAGWRSSAETHCWGHSFTRMLAGGFVVDMTSTLLSIHKMESSYTGQAGSPGWPSSQGPQACALPRSGCSTPLQKQGPAYIPRSLSPQREMTSGVDRRMERDVSL